MQQRAILNRLATARRHAILVTRQIEELEQLYRQSGNADGIPAIVEALEELERCRWSLSMLHFDLMRDDDALPPGM
jgi:hypothetical protein